MKEFLIELIRNYAGEIIVAVVAILGSVIGGFIAGFSGYKFSKKLAEEERKDKNRVRKEEHYLELLGKLNSLTTVNAGFVVELSQKTDPKDKEELIKEAKETLFSFAEVKPIAELFGTPKINSLIQEIGEESQKTSLEAQNIFQKTGHIPIKVSLLESGKRLFAKKAELISEMKRSLEE